MLLVTSKYRIHIHNAYEGQRKATAGVALARLCSRSSCQGPWASALDDMLRVRTEWIKLTATYDSSKHELPHSRKPRQLMAEEARCAIKLGLMGIRIFHVGPSRWAGNHPKPPAAVSKKQAFLDWAAKLKQKGSRSVQRSDEA